MVWMKVEMNLFKPKARRVSLNQRSNNNYFKKLLTMILVPKLCLIYLGPHWPTTLVFFVRGKWKATSYHVVRDIYCYTCDVENK